MPRHIDVRITQTANGVRGRLVVSDRSGGSTVREIEAATCAEAVDGLALVAALLFDPLAGEHPHAEQAAPPPRPVEAPLKPALAEKPRRPSYLELESSFFAASGPTPRVVPGAWIAGAYESPEMGPITVIVEVGARFAAPATVSSTEGVASFEWWTATLAACPALSIADGTFSPAVCVTAEQGVVEATGSSTNNPRSSDRGWTSVGAGISLRFTVLPPLFAFVRAEGAFPFRRDRFVLGTEQIHEVPLVGFRGALGLGVRFW